MRKRPGRRSSKSVTPAVNGITVTESHTPPGRHSRSYAGDDPSACACATGSRKARLVDERTRESNIQRLRRIEGQVRGIQGMIDDDRYCADVLVQLSSVQEALRAVGREVMRNHLRHCATEAIRAGGKEADEMYDELLRLIYRHAP
ncbi:MAG: metal-sensitive transcriptional regulator [Gemmatimonadota bacterium]